LNGSAGEPLTPWLRWLLVTGDRLRRRPVPSALGDPVSQPDPCPTPDHPARKGVDRRTVITSAGVVGIGLVGGATLGGCGGGSGTAAPTASAGSAKDAIRVADIPVGGGKVFPAIKVVVTQPKAGEFKAFSATCTHMGCLVASVANGTINCPCHGSTYDMTTGLVKGGPAPAPLPSKTATVSGGSITIS
jgi:Rieske Fe-S protein